MNMELIKGIEELQEKATKYENMRDRYTQWANRLEVIKTTINDSMKDCNDIITEMDSRVNISVRAKSQINFIALIPEWYDKLQQGLDLTPQILRDAYPDWGNYQVMYLIKKLSKMPGVRTSRDMVDGRVVHYIYDKDFK